MIDNFDASVLDNSRAGSAPVQIDRDPLRACKLRELITAVRAAGVIVTRGRRHELRFVHARARHLFCLPIDGDDLSPLMISRCRVWMREIGLDLVLS